MNSPIVQSHAATLDIHLSLLIAGANDNESLHFIVDQEQPSASSYQFICQWQTSERYQDNMYHQTALPHPHTLIERVHTIRSLSLTVRLLLYLIRYRYRDSDG